MPCQRIRQRQWPATPASAPMLMTAGGAPAWPVMANTRGPPVALTRAADLRLPSRGCRSASGAREAMATTARDSACTGRGGVEVSDRHDAGIGLERGEQPLIRRAFEVIEPIPFARQSGGVQQPGFDMLATGAPAYRGVAQIESPPGGYAVAADPATSPRTSQRRELEVIRSTGREASIYDESFGSEDMSGPLPLLPVVRPLQLGGVDLLHLRKLRRPWPAARCGGPASGCRGL
jgi:hypothetical protein